jgi:aldose 1-epimerase
MQGATVHDQTLAVPATHYTPVDAESIPTGAVEPLAGTPLDFREAKPLRGALAGLPGGVDHNFVTCSQPEDPTEPGVQRS